MVQQGVPRNAPIDVPSKMKALITVEGKTAEVQETDVPRPGEGEILVKVNYVAQVRLDLTSKFLQPWNY